MLLDSSGTGFRGFSLAHNVKNENQVIGLLEKAKNAGALIIKPAQKTGWGGFSRYFSDLDGHLWEIAHNPNFWLGHEDDEKEEKDEKDKKMGSYEKQVGKGVMM